MHESPPSVSIRELDHVDEAAIAGLTDVLMDCVHAGASVGFMQPLARTRCEQFWRKVAADVACGNRALLVAEDAAGVCGTVQLILGLPENQPHRADLCKLLVHRRARRHGLGAALMTHAEQVAQARGRSLLVLDTTSGSDADRLYTRLRWNRVGDIPGFALLPNGVLSATTYFYKIIPPLR